jgi:hypothetical protein
MELASVGDFRQIGVHQICDGPIHQIVRFSNVNARFVLMNVKGTASMMNDARHWRTNADEWCHHLDPRAIRMCLKRLKPTWLINYVIVTVGRKLGFREVSSNIARLVGQEKPFPNLMVERSCPRKLAQFGAQ